MKFLKIRQAVALGSGHLAEKTSIHSLQVVQIAELDSPLPELPFLFLRTSS
jgi:hypothetical protein